VLAKMNGMTSHLVRSKDEAERAQVDDGRHENECRCVEPETESLWRQPKFATGLQLCDPVCAGECWDSVWESHQKRTSRFAVRAPAMPMTLTTMTKAPQAMSDVYGSPSIQLPSTPLLSSSFLESGNTHAGTTMTVCPSYEQPKA